ncbi:hypothetical protein N7478_011521 [Penicillium angulare]|uniref:uncharacterized protein n=1 Tax=Penicillium angulare TaxID=116970 RepID=UPI002541C99F|nr:uncharacterized protein N7478_011521 [Penicillium angulare]KAJ5263916.1 hypothetical protein N7478_011521 [Penicillium angulare]
MGTSSELKSISPELNSSETIQKSVFSAHPTIFILPTHVSLDELHEVEFRLFEHGGNLTYDIAEAGLILGKIGRKKRAALELRSRGLFTEEIPDLNTSLPSISGIDQQPPLKRQKTQDSEVVVKASTQVVDLCTDSEVEEYSEKGLNDSSQSPEFIAKNEGQVVTVLKLDWLEQSIEKGEPLPQRSFLIYKGRKVISTPPDVPKPPSTAVASQIMKRATEDASVVKYPTQSHSFHSRRSKGPTDSTEKSSQRNPPTLYRQTTSEHDETVSLPPQPDWVHDQVGFACMRSAPLHSPNEEFISQLVKIRRIRELTLDEIGVRAYSTSIAAIAAYPYVIKRPSEILALPGCDAKIANLFAEFQQHRRCSHSDKDGNVATADALDSDPVLRVLNTFNGIWGVGAKTARNFYYSRGWRDLDDIVEFGWDSLSRVQQIGVKFFDEFQAGVSRVESENIASIVKRHANDVRPNKSREIEAIIVGGYRRGKELSGDVDIILTHHDDAVTRGLVVDVVASLEKEKYITHTLSLHLTATSREQQTRPLERDETGKHFDALDKALVVWQSPEAGNKSADDVQKKDDKKRNTNPHCRVDIIISPWRTIGCAVLGWTGSTTFQRDLRRHSKKAHGWRFDSTGIRERSSSGPVVDLEHNGNTWEERERLVMEGLGIGWRPPEERCSR